MTSPLTVIRMGLSQVGQPRSGIYDSLNGDHPWAYWCLAFQESTHRNVGLTVSPMPNAVSAGMSHDLSGGPPPLGATVYFDQTFYYPDGHTGISLGNGQLLGTVTDGKGVGMRWWNETTPGFMGWTYMDGVTPGARPPISPGTDPVPPSHIRLPNNDWEDEGTPEIIIGGGFLRLWMQVDIGADPLTVFGYPTANESTATIIEKNGTMHTRTIQRFERAVMQYQPENAFPWDITVVPLNSSIVEDSPL